jgi:hypothetical protein
MSYRNRSEKHGYRTDRIERAAAEALECDLLPSLEDPLLNDLHVLSIEVKTLACIRVTLAPGPAASTADPQAIEAALSRVENKLRIELAGILRIKRMPMLRLTYVPLPIGSQRTGGDA